MDDSERDKMIQETHDQVNTLTTVLLGVPDTDEKGLVGKVNDVCEAHAKLKTVVFWIIGILGSAGIITGSSIGIDKLVKGG